jgi:hypothetical protein
MREREREREVEQHPVMREDTSSLRKIIVLYLIQKLFVLIK